MPASRFVSDISSGDGGYLTVAGGGKGAAIVEVYAFGFEQDVLTGNLELGGSAKLLRITIHGEQNPCEFCCPGKLVLRKENNFSAGTVRCIIGLSAIVRAGSKESGYQSGHK